MIDFAAVAKLYHICFPYDLRDDEHIISIAKRNNVLTEADSCGSIIAAAIVGGCTIYMLAVHPDHRERGLGSALLERCEKHIRASGHDLARIGVGDGYLMPGVPTSVMPYPESLCAPVLYPDLTDDSAAFFRKRGYIHGNFGWSESNIFDMRAKLDTLPEPSIKLGDTVHGIVYRLAEEGDRAAVLDCVRDAHEEFCRYYQDGELYREGSQRRVVAAFEKEIAVGAIISGRDSIDGGSIGCTSTRQSYRGRGVATRVVKLATEYLRKLGLSYGFLGYTYTGLDRLYGSAGFRISVYYLMAEKKI